MTTPPPFERPFSLLRGGRFALALLLAICSACSMSVKITPLTDEHFPPTDAQTLKLYGRKPPGKWIDVVRIEIEGRESDEFADTRERARQEAARLGAEALWIFGERTESRTASIPPTEFSWTETRSSGSGRYKVEHTRKTPGGTVRYGVPVCKYVGLRRSAPTAPADAAVPLFACPHCAKEWESPSEDDVYECSCSQYMYLLSCPGCRKRFVLAQAGESACPECRAILAVVLCPHCNHADTDKQYAGEHRCDFCRKSYWGMICPACHRTLVSATALASAQCPECGQAFDLSRSDAKAYLGLTLKTLPNDKGLAILEIIEESPAARSGLRVGDIVTMIEDDRGERWQGTLDDYLPWIQSKRPGSTIAITARRNDQLISITVVLSARPD